VDKFSTVSNSIISGLTKPQVWPSNKDIPLFVGVPVIVNHRVIAVVQQNRSRCYECALRKDDTDWYVAINQHVCLLSYA